MILSFVKKILSVTTTRKSFTFTAKCGVAFCFIMASYSGCNILAAALFFTFVSTFTGLNNSLMNNMDLSPNYAPSIMSIVSTCSALMGISAPNVVGVLTSNVKAMMNSMTE